MKKLLLFITCALSVSAVAAQNDSTQIPFWNYRLSFEKRAEDLVSKLSLEEKVAQMLNHAPAIPRLGIPAYDWWSEVLHGVARTPFKTTVYPQAIAMAATWDTAALYLMASQSALEGRAVQNKTIALGRSGERYLGLTYWTPNINIFRDPRWGRGQETYGEDPFLTAMLGKAFVRGLQGEDPKYLQAAACAKHYAVHSGPEPTRHVFDVDPSNYDLWNTYLPAFRELVTNAHVAGVMCAYNAFRKQPCCGSDLLMVNILRNQWKFTGYVTSDCGGIDDFFKTHKLFPNAEAASADAVFHGTDVECGNSAYRSLVQAVKDGAITESQIDISVRRLFMIRLRLGMFDPPSMVRFAQTPATVLESPEHKAQALKMARESIVLLKNENAVLPLSKSLKKLAVLGPNANNPIAVLGNYNGTPSEIVTAIEGIRRKCPQAEIVYEQAVNFTNDTLLQFEDISSQYAYEGKQGFKAEYFTNKELSGDAVVLTENKLDHIWQEGQPVTATIKSNDFSARYSTLFTARTTGAITFEIEADDGYRLLVNDKEVINAWQRNRWGARTYKLLTQKDSAYKIVVEYWQGEGNAHVRLRAGNYVKTDLNALAERLKDVDAILFIGGISPQLEGEEMNVPYPGFKGGDRTSIMLPAVQTQLMQSLRKINKPLVFVMMTGSAIAIPWEAENVPAIVNAWYGGQSAGTAIADVLFGDYNPSGRLPVTFYKGDEDLPPFDDYSMDNRTYRYFKGVPLYPFGHGLSYTSFRYEKLTVPAAIKAGANIQVSVTVTNSGARDGEEVAELYVSYGTQQKIKVPQKALKGFQRVSLKKGEQKTVRFSLDPLSLAILDDEGKPVSPKGTLTFSVGGGQPGSTIASSSNVLQKTINIQ